MPALSWIRTNDPSQTTNVIDDLVNPPHAAFPNPWIAVSNFVAKSRTDGTGVDLTWTNPLYCQLFSNVWVFKRRFGFLNTPIDVRGEFISSVEVTSFFDSNVIPGEVYYYTAFGVS